MIYFYAMSFLKYSLYFALLSGMSTLSACHNGKTPEIQVVSGVDSDPAYQTINDSIRQFPMEAALYLRRAARLTLTNAHDEAYADFKKAWTLEPVPQNGLPLAANLQVLGKNKERFLILKTLHHQSPSDPQVGRLLADAYATDGNSKQALISYNEMLAMDSLDAETYYEKAILLEQLKDTTQAIVSLQKAYAIRGVDTYGLELAHLYAEQKNPKALQICDFILKHDADQLFIDPLFIKGIFYSNVKLYSKAIEQFDICIKRDWKTTDAYLEKGRAYFRMQKFQEAIQTFNMAITVSNTDPDAYYWLGRSYESLFRKTDAIINYQKAVALDKNFTEARQRIKNLDSGFVEPTR